MTNLRSFATLLRAEWIKINKNIKLTGSLVWVFPITAIVLNSFGLLFARLLPGENIEPSLWTDDFSMIWLFINSFPNNVFGRLLPFAFMATIFAGEYQWGTWKNIVPRRSRYALIISKQLVLVAIITLAFFLTSVVTVLIKSLRYPLVGVAYPPALSGSALQAFIPFYLQEAGFAIVSLLLMTAFAAIAAILTRSILGSLLLGLGLSVLELISGLLLAILGMAIHKPDITNVYRFAPSYSIENIRSWLVEGKSFLAFLPEFTVESSLLFSVLVLLIWLLGSSGLAIWLFRRQDITG